MATTELDSATEAENAVRKLAQDVLQELDQQKVRVQQHEAAFEASRNDPVLSRHNILNALRRERDDVRVLSKGAVDASGDVLRAARHTEMAHRRSGSEDGQAETRYDESQRIADRLLSTSHAVSIQIDTLYDAIMEHDRRALIDADRAHTIATRNQLHAVFKPPTKNERFKFTADRRDFTQTAQEEMPKAIRKRNVQQVLIHQKPATPAAGTVPVGVRMAGDPQMPVGWSIPGDPAEAWMWAEFTLMGTQNTLLLPVRRSTVSDVTEALGKMMGKSHEEFTLHVKQGCCFRKLKDTDVVSSKILVRGLKSWEREKQKYNYPYVIVGAGHNGLRQALECLKQHIEDFVLLDRLDKVGGAAWLRLANRSSKLQTELGTYHLAFDDIYPLPTGLPTWPTRDEILKHFEDVAVEQGIMPNVQLCTRLVGVKVDKLTRLQMLDQGRGDSDPNSQHYKLTVQKQTAQDPPGFPLKEPTPPKAPESKKSSKVGGKPAPKPAEPAKEDALLDDDLEPPAPKEEPTKSTFAASAVLMFPGNLCAPRMQHFKGEEVFGGPIAYGTYDSFDFAEAKGRRVAVCGMGSLAVENVRLCIEGSASQCYLVCRRKNLVLPRVVSWLINQSISSPSAAEVVRAMQPMYEVANDNPLSYYAVSPDAALIQQNSRFPVSDTFFLAQFYGMLEVVTGEVKRLLLNTIQLDDGRKINANCILKCLGFTGSSEVDSLIHATRMFGFWADSDFRRWVYCESPNLDFMNIATTALSPLSMRLAEFPLHFLSFPNPDFKELVDNGNMHWQTADVETGQPAYVLNARDAAYVMSLVMMNTPALRVRDYVKIKRDRQVQCHPIDNFIEEAAAEWDQCLRAFAGEETDDHEPPKYPYTAKEVRQLNARWEEDARERSAGGGGAQWEVALRDTSSDAKQAPRAPMWNPFLNMYF